MSTLLVCGGRTFGDFNLVDRVLRRLLEEWRFTDIAQGEAPGADHMARIWSEQMRVPCKGYRIEDHVGPEVPERARGAVRNGAMLRIARPRWTLAFKGGAGTADMIVKSMKAGVRTYQVLDSGLLRPVVPPPRARGLFEQPELSDHELDQWIESRYDHKSEAHHRARGGSDAAES